MSSTTPHHNHELCAANLISRAERACARRGSRLTDQRREVLACVAESHAAVGAYHIIERMAERGSRPAPISVYRALDFLLAHGLVHKIESRNAFVACSHPHDGLPAVMLICDTCGLVAELDAAEVFDRLRMAAASDGFASERIMVEIAGQCRFCRGEA
jgi:Fur family zinc uptake transcriptional regulator